MLSENEAEPFLKDVELSQNVPPENLYRRCFRRATDFCNIYLSYPAVSHSLLFVLTSLFWGSYFIFIPSLNIGPRYLKHSERGNSTIISNADYIHCGSSVEEARSRDCTYDILNNHWVPSSCIDGPAIQEYQADGSWYGYADWNHTRRLDIKTMGETPVYYTSERDHIVHCAMLWRKQYRALMDGRKYLDSIVVDAAHTMHCSKFLIEMTERGPDFSTMPIKVHVGFAGCHVRDGLDWTCSIAPSTEILWT